MSILDDHMYKNLSWNTSLKSQLCDDLFKSTCESKTQKFMSIYKFVCDLLKIPNSKFSTSFIATVVIHDESGLREYLSLSIEKVSCLFRKE